RNTMPGQDGEATQLQPRSDGPPERPPGPATLMSRLLRQELDRQNRGGPLWQFLNQPLVLVLLFLLTVGLIVLGIWPVSAETRFQRGAALMQSDHPEDWEEAWATYLEPLSRDADNPHREEVEQFRQRAEDARLMRKAELKAGRAGPVSEGQWFYQE